MKTIALLIAGVAGLPTLATAADIPPPVKQIMDATVNNWSGDDIEWVDIFDPAKLDKLYSKDFAARYREAAKHPAVDDGISPFDYDVIINGQDACPLEDLKLTPQKTAEGQDEVVVSFRKMGCADGDEAKAVSTVRFEMVTEDGKPVVDDIMLQDDETKETSSLKSTMDEIAKQ